MPEQSAVGLPFQKHDTEDRFRTDGEQDLICMVITTMDEIKEKAGKDDALYLAQSLGGPRTEMADLKTNSSTSQTKGSQPLSAPRDLLCQRSELEPEGGGCPCPHPKKHFYSDAYWCVVMDTMKVRPAPHGLSFCFNY